MGFRGVTGKGGRKHNTMITPIEMIFSQYFPKLLKKKIGKYSV